MIRYALRCPDDHRFEGWFGSSTAFDRQRASAQLACPVCGSSEVDRALMAPAVVGPARAHAVEADDAPTADAPAPPLASDGPPATVALLDEKAQKLRALLRSVREAAKAHGVDVGRRFPDEARRMHYGETEHRGIYGEADLHEARALLEEGIDIIPLPMLPDERN
ncbi:DUF1178 family protein [Acuticoccus sp.]|uniref:DUF1178 family protein n=1 Tax=Acuticoccus sp. TaxID=1904378 RepID=UPI003B52185F